MFQNINCASKSLAKCEWHQDGRCVTQSRLFRTALCTSLRRQLLLNVYSVTQCHVSQGNQLALKNTCYMMLSGIALFFIRDKGFCTKTSQRNMSNRIYHNFFRNTFVSPVLTFHHQCSEDRSPDIFTFPGCHLVPLPTPQKSDICSPSCSRPWEQNHWKP